LGSIEKNDVIKEADQRSRKGAEYALKIQRAFEAKADPKKLGEMANEFVAGGGDISVLSEQLKGVYEDYKELEKAETALDRPGEAARYKTMGNEILAFQKDLVRSNDVKTPVGKEFIRRFRAGEFKDVEEANAALDKFASDAKGGDAKTREASEAEFSVLHGLVAEKFKGEKGQKLEVEGGAIEDKEIEDVFGGLGE
jgi:hypothetical protein